MPLPLGRNKRNSKSPRVDVRDSVGGAGVARDAHHDADLSGYLAALAPEDTETTLTGKGFGGASVMQLRLPPMAGEQLNQLAVERNSSPQALAQEWVLQRLQWEEDRAQADGMHS